MPDLAREFFEKPQGLLGTIYTDHWHLGGELLLNLALGRSMSRGPTEIDPEPYDD